MGESSREPRWSLDWLSPHRAGGKARRRHSPDRVGGRDRSRAKTRRRAPAEARRLVNLGKTRASDRVRARMSRLGLSANPRKEAQTEGEGFEPSIRLTTDNGFRDRRIRPLCHPSSGEGGIRTLDAGIHPHNALAGRRLQPLGHFSGHDIVSTAFRRSRPIPLQGQKKITLQWHAHDGRLRHAERAGSPLTYPTGLERPLRRAFPFPGSVS
jgi:hypothetical protein